MKMRRIARILLLGAFVCTLLVNVMRPVTGYGADGVEVSDFAALSAALSQKKARIIITEDIELTAGLTVGYSVTITGNRGGTGDRPELTLREGLTARHFLLSRTGIRVELENLTLKGHGDAAKIGGGIELKAVHAVVTGCEISGVSGQFIGAISSLTDSQLEIRDSAILENHCTMNGGGGGVYFVGASLTIENSEIRDNHAPGGAGGVHIRSGAPVVISDTDITGNTSGTQGGGIYNDGAGSMTITGGSISRNRAETGGGGGVYYSDKSQTSGALTIVGTTLEENRARTGGAVNAYSYGGSFLLEDCVLSGNRALRAGGAVFATGLKGRDGRIALTDCELTDNAVLPVDGATDGGAISQGAIEMTVTGGKISGNTAPVNGGGICSSVGGLEVSGCEISSNTAGRFGGGLYLSVQTQAAISDSLISDNDAQCNGDEGTGGGGGISHNRGSLALTRTVLSGNSSGRRGGGICKGEGELTILDCDILSNDAGTSGGGIYSGTGQTSIADSLISNNRANRDAGQNSLIEISGGGIYHGGGSADRLSMTDTVVSLNTVLQDKRYPLIHPRGGGLALRGAAAELRRCAFSGNEASESGGGIYARGDLDAYDSAFVANRAGTEGGAVSIWTQSASGGSGYPYYYRFFGGKFDDNYAPDAGGAICVGNGNIYMEDTAAAGETVRLLIDGTAFAGNWCENGMDWRLDDPPLPALARYAAIYDEVAKDIRGISQPSEHAATGREQKKHGVTFTNLFNNYDVNSYIPVVVYDPQGGAWSAAEHNREDGTGHPLTEIVAVNVPFQPISLGLARDGHAFGGWYTARECLPEQEWDFTKPHYYAMTLYAKWTQGTAQKPDPADPKDPVQPGQPEEPGEQPEEPGGPDVDPEQPDPSPGEEPEQPHTPAEEPEEPDEEPREPAAPVRPAPPESDQGWQYRPDGDGYLVLDDEGVPLGTLVWSEEREEWVFSALNDDSELPRTGSEGLELPILYGLLVLGLCVAFLRPRRRGGSPPRP